MLLLLFKLFILAIVLQLSLAQDQQQQQQVKKPTRIEASVIPNDAQIALFKCSSNKIQNPSLYFELATGSWKFIPRRLINEIQPDKQCLETNEDIFNLCKKLYSNLDVKNIQYLEKSIEFSAYGKQRKLYEKESVQPYRCLHGEYESKSLFVPADCQFKTLYTQNNECETQDYWKKQSEQTCKDMNMIINTSELLKWCDSNKLQSFSGVEFICCPNIDLNSIIEDEDIDDDGDSSDDLNENLIDDTIQEIKIKDFEAINGDAEEQLRHKNKLNEIDARYESQRVDITNKWQNERKIAGVEHIEGIDKTYNQKLKDLENAKLDELLREEKAHNDVLQSELDEDKYDATIELKNEVESATFSIDDAIKVEKIKKRFAELFNLYERDRSLQVSIYKRLNSQYPDEAKKQLKQIVDNIKLIDVKISEKKNIMKGLGLDKKFNSIFDREIFNRFKQVQDEASKIVKEFVPETPVVEPSSNNKVINNNNNDIIIDSNEDSDYIDDNDDDTYSDDNDNDDDDDRTQRTKAKATKTTTTTTKAPLPTTTDDYDGDDDLSNESVDNDIDINDSLDDSDDDDSKLIDLNQNQNDPLLDRIQQKGQEKLQQQQKGSPSDTNLPKYKYNSPYKVNGDDSDDDDDDDDLPRSEKIKKQTSSTANIVLVVAVCSFSLLIVIIAAGMLIRRKNMIAKYNKTKKGGFIQVDTCSPEEVHVNQMQINGYENPAYKFFEQNQQA